MKHSVRIAILLAFLFPVKILAAQEGAPSHGASASDAEEATRWSRTHLSVDPSLRTHLDRTQAFLGDRSSGLGSEVSLLKAEAVIDRRTSSRIMGALHHALDLMRRVSEAFEAPEPMDGWTARMIAYELGMAADTLAEEAKPIEDQLQVDGNGGTAQLATVAAEQRRNLIKKLREGGDLLKETARAIVIDLQ